MFENWPRHSGHRLKITQGEISVIIRGFMTAEDVKCKQMDKENKEEGETKT